MFPSACFFGDPVSKLRIPSSHTLNPTKKLYETLAARINRIFYFHPRTIGRQIHLIRTPKQFALLFKIAASLIMRR